MNLTFNEYQAGTSRTAVYGDQIAEIMDGITSDDPQQLIRIVRLLRLAYVGLGLGEAGEVQNKLKKVIRDNQGELLDKKRLAIAKELGGNLWYISQAANEIDMTLEDIAQMNLDELASRAERGTIHGDGDER